MGKTVSVITKLLLNVELYPVSDCSDQVFTADASLSLNNQGKDVSIISKFTWGPRRNSSP